ncbi:hypothetical protein QJS10_CPB13g00682 [Acorus calamus]|uniref:R13L1/DRL21-like LRR repeat region domain-containing protein n=1 Tax=Acorus calamus TaxID=4465 RepID=A0AAV9DM25_ACOCL|nr:hypothetical protein QJS10_CPB13g00682 [Acorus calamus]
MLELRWINDNQDVNHRTRELDEQVLEGLQPPPYLDTLIIKYHRGVKCPSWMNSRYLSSLEYINLHICNRWEQLPPFGQLPNLKFLRIEGMNGLKEVGLEFFGGYNGAGFPSLEHLSLEQMSEWEGWSSAAEKGQFFPRLQYLTVRDCPKLRRFPSLPITLKDLIIKNAGFIALPDLWGVDNNGPSISEILICDCPHLISLCEGFLCHHLTALHTLHIDQCSELVSLPGFGLMSSLKSLIVERCPKLAPLQEGGGLPSSLKELCLLNCPNVLSKSLLVPLQNLTSTTLIMMQQYPNLSSCVREALQHLISLECLTIRYVKDIIIHDYEMMYLLSSRSHEAAVLLDYSLNTGGPMSRVQLQIRTLVPDHDEEDNALLVCLRSHLTALSNLSINNCPNVTPLLVDGLPHLASLKFLEVISCRGLTSLPEEETLRHSMKIEELIIRDCRDLTSQGGLHALSQLKSLTIEGCPGLAHLQLKQLTALESLIIDGCEELVLLRGIAALIFLEQLDVNKCPKLTSLTEGEEEGLGRLSSLETLSISYCDSLQRLPIGLQGLSCLRKLHLMMCPLVGSFEVGGNGGGLSASLERLSVTKCPVLMKQCRKEDGPDWPKIKHVPNIRFGQVIVQGFPGVEIFQS